MGLRRFVDVGAVFAWPQWNQPLQEARDFHTVTGNPTPGIGDWGPYLTFDGVNDYITLNQAWEDQLRFDSSTQDFSVVAWVRRAVTGARQTVIDKRDGVGDGWVFYVAADDTVHFVVDADDAGSTGTIADALWHNLIAVVDRSATIQIYVDGTADGSVASVAEAMATTTSPRIGAESAAAANYWNGDQAGDFVIDRVLSAEECLGIATGKAFDYL